MKLIIKTYSQIILSIELFRIHDNKLKSETEKITKPSADNKKEKSSNSSFVKRAAELTDNSPGKDLKQESKQENPVKPTDDKQDKTSPAKKMTESTQNSNKLRSLTTNIMERLLTKSTKIGQGATSIVYKVKNILINKGYLCLKVLNDLVIKKMNNDTKEEKSTKLTWSDNDDDDDDDDDDDNDHPKEEMEINIDVVRQLLTEYEILNFIHHPSIVEVFGFYRGDSKYNPAILLEYCKYNLEQVVNGIDDIYLVSIIYEICSAMAHVHHNKLIHCDLKMKNILINSQKHVKICDFGIARVVDLETLTSITRGIGTLAFMAPEAVKENASYTEKVDV